MAAPNGHRLHLADLLAEDSFRLELLSGGADASAREVLGAHAVEVDEPTRWLGRDWVMLTTGVRLHGDTEAQRTLSGSPSRQWSIASYPPGVPALLPGEHITSQTIAYLRELAQSGARLHGASDPTFQTIHVLAQEASP